MRSARAEGALGIGKDWNVVGYIRIVEVYAEGQRGADCTFVSTISVNLE